MSDVVSFNIAGTRLPLFLFPSVALGPTEYLELGKYFSPEQPWHVLIPLIKSSRLAHLQSVGEDLVSLRLPERLVWCFGTVEFASAGRQPEQSAVRLLVLASPEISP